MTIGLVEQIDSFGLLLQSLPEDPNNTKVRGDAFEQLCQWFLRTDPEYSRILKTVWLWNDWLMSSYRPGKRVGLEVGEALHRLNNPFLIAQA